MKAHLLSILGACALLFSACGKEDVPKPIEGVFPERMLMDISDTSMAIGSVNFLAPLILPENATDKFLRWSSSDSSVVSVHGDGQMKARKPGTAVITATTRSGSASISKKVVVQNDIKRIEGRVQYATGRAQWETTVRMLIHNRSNSPMLIKHIEEYKPPISFMPYPFGFFDFAIAAQTLDNLAYYSYDSSTEKYSSRWYTKFYFLLNKEKYVITVYNGHYLIEDWDGVIKSNP